MPSGDTFWSAVVWLAVVGAVGGAVFVALARVLAPRELADARLSLRNLRGRRAQA
jgi:Na+/H+-dicarboxylate symporter